MADRGPSTSLAAWLSLVFLAVGYLAMQLVAGAPASPLVPALPRGVRVPAWTDRGARALGLDRLGPSALTFLALGVGALLVGAFVVLVWQTWRGRVRVAPVLVAAGLSLALSVAGPLILSRDVYSYASYGRMLAFQGANPYVQSPSAFPNDPFASVLSPEWIHTRSVYGPTFILISAGVARATPGSPAATVLWFKVLAGAALAGATVLAVGSCRRLRPARSAMAAAVVGLNPVLVLHTVGGGHNDALAALLLAGALWLAVAGQARREGPASIEGRRTIAPFLGATATLTLAALVKLPMIVALLVWLWWVFGTGPSERRSAIGAIHAAVVAATGIADSAPLWAGLKTLRSLSTLASVEGWASGVRLVARGVEALARATSGPDAASTAEHVVRVAFLVVYAVALWKLLSRPRLRSISHAWGVSLLLLALAIPYLLPWYSAWFLLFLPLLSDDVLIWIGLAASLTLALTGIPAEPGATPALWRDMLLGVHYGAAPIMLGLLVVVVTRVVGRSPTQAGA